MTASFETPTRATLKVGDFVSVEFVGPPGGVRVYYGVGRVTKSPVHNGVGRFEVNGVSSLGPFRRDFPRSDLTRLVPAQPVEAKIPEDGYPSRDELVDAFRAYLPVDLGKEGRAVRESLVKAYLRGANVSRAVDLRPERRADAIAFVEEQMQRADEASFEIKHPELPEPPGTDYRSALKALSDAANRIVTEMRCPAYIIDPEKSKQAARIAKRAGFGSVESMQTPEATRPGAGYDPYRLTNEQLQLAIDNVLKVIRGGVGPNINAGKPETICALLEDHLADLLEVQRERAGGVHEGL